MTANQSVREYLVPITNLGRAMFPGEDLFAKELQGLFSEMLVDHLSQGKPMTTIALGASLAAHTPQRVLDSTEQWKPINLERWEKELRPKIFAVMESFLLNGGFEERIHGQEGLLSALERAGVEIQGKSLALDIMATAGDWHRQFMTLVEMGRPQGIRFLPGQDYRHDVASNALLDSGFHRDYVAKFVACVG